MADSNLEWADSNLEWAFPSPECAFCQADNGIFSGQQMHLSGRNPHLSDRKWHFSGRQTHLSGPQMHCQSNMALSVQQCICQTTWAFVGATNADVRPTNAFANPEKARFPAKSGISGPKGRFFRSRMPFLRKRMRFPAFVLAPAAPARGAIRRKRLPRRGNSGQYSPELKDELATAWYSATEMFQRLDIHPVRGLLLCP